MVKIRKIDAFWHSSALLLLMRIANLCLGLLLNILLSRHLGPEQYGVFAFGAAVLALAVVPAGFGFDQYLASEIPVLRANGRIEAIRGLVRRAYQTTTVVSLAILGMWLMLWALVPDLLVQALWLSSGIALAALPFLALMHTRFGVLRGEHRSVAGQVPLFVLQPLSAVIFVTLAIVLLPSAVDGLFAQFLAAISIALVCLFAFTALKPRQTNAACSEEPGYATRRWLRGAAPMMLATGLAILISNIGALLLGTMIGERAVGLYQPAIQLASFVALVLGIVNLPLGPRIAQLFAERRMAELQRLLNEASATCLAISVIIAFPLLVLGSKILSIYGDEFATAAPALAILTLGQLVNVGLGPTALILMMTGGASQVAKVMASGAVFCLLLSLILIPYHGIIGAAVGATSALVAWNAAAAWLTIRNTGLCPTVLLSFLVRNPLYKGTV